MFLMKEGGRAESCQVSEGRGWRLALKQRTILTSISTHLRQQARIPIYQVCHSQLPDNTIFGVLTKYNKKKKTERGYLV